MRKLINAFFGHQYDGELSGIKALKIFVGCAAILAAILLGSRPALIWLYYLTH